jgi:mitochondrial splicing suppressor protein 51
MSPPIQQHKELCNQHVEHAECLRSEDNPFNMVPLPEGLTLSDLDQRLEKWVKFHNPTLMAAAVQLFIEPRFDHGGSAGKYFRIRTANVLAISEAMNKDAPWPESIRQTAKMRDENERLNRGTVAAVYLDSHMLGVQVVPFRLRSSQLSELRVLDNWMDHLIRDVENGKKFTQFGD